MALDPQHRANISFADDHIISPLCSSRTPGHCASNNDAGAFRTGQPYFTYQLKPTSGIVTTGICAAPPPPAAPGAEKITGGGRIGSPINFGFVAQNTPANAAVSYHDSNANVDVHSSNITEPTVTFSGNCATFAGSAKVNQQPGYNYRVNACDNNDPKAGAGQDTFFITVKNAVTGSVVYSNGGVITSGDIEIHTN